MEKLVKRGFNANGHQGTWNYIDATSECVKVTNNKLTLENINHIVGVFVKREEVKHFEHLASYEEVSGNDYNLSVSTYVEAEDTR